MTARDTILARVREALMAKAPMPGADGHEAGENAAAPRRADQEARRWLPPVGAGHEEMLQRFEANSQMLKTQFLPCADADAAFLRLKELAAESGWRRVATHRGELTDGARDALGLPSLLTTGGYAADELETCDAAVTECDALVAQTGSVVLTARSGGGRALSVLPPHHVVLARRDQLLPDLPAAYERLRQRYQDAWPSLMTFITGPSRTGDIERILVLGAHGPKRLTVLLW